MANKYDYKLTDFTPSDEYKRLQGKSRESEDAYQLALQRIQGGTSYADAYKNAINKYTNRPEFSYDINGDALYQQYKNQYQTLGKQAAQNVAAQSADLTGGYGNSYGTTASNQAYQQYLSQLNDMVPTLYQQAYSHYNDEGNALLNQINVLGNADQMEYGRQQDAVSMALQKLQAYYGMQNDQYGKDYNLWSDTNSMGMQNHFNAISAQQTDAQRIESARQFDKSHDLDLQKLAWQKAESERDMNTRLIEAMYKQNSSGSSSKKNSSTTGLGNGANTKNGFSMEDVNSEKVNTFIASMPTIREMSRINYGKKDRVERLDYIKDYVSKWYESGELSEADVEYLLDYYKID